MKDPFSFQEFVAPWTKDNPSYKFNIIEEQPIGMVLTTLEATDKDSSIAKYELEDNEYFEIDNVTGEI